MIESIQQQTGCGDDCCEPDWTQRGRSGSRAAAAKPPPPAGSSGYLFPINTLSAGVINPCSQMLANVRDGDVPLFVCLSVCSFVYRLFFLMQFGVRRANGLLV